MIEALVTETSLYRTLTSAAVLQN